MSTNKQTKSVPCTPTTSTSSFSPRSSVSSASGTSSPALNVCRSIAHHAGSMMKQIVKIPSRSPSRSKDEKPDMSKMRTVTPVYDHDLKRWVWPHPVTVHRDEPTGLPCKQLPNSAKSTKRTNG